MAGEIATIRNQDLQDALAKLRERKGHQVVLEAVESDALLRMIDTKKV